MRKICYITGYRSDYAHMQPVLRALKNDRGVKLQIIATGAHLSKKFGYTLKDIEADGFRINKKVDMMWSNATRKDIAHSIGIGVTKLVKALHELKPDIVLLFGDRFETLTGAVAAFYSGLPVAHIHGGDNTSSGELDDANRHAVTRLSHLHLAATNSAAERIKKFGEEKWRIHTVGSPTLDMIINIKYPSRGELFKEFGLDDKKKLFIVLYCTLPTSRNKAGFQVREIMEAVKAMNEQTIVSYPPPDPSSEIIIKTITSYRDCKNVRVFQSIPHEKFLGLMKHADLMISNSTSSIIEAPSLGLPVIYTGQRQDGRGFGKNIVQIECKKQDIIRAAKFALSNKTFRKIVAKKYNPWGDGKASGRILRILKSVKIDRRLMNKKLTY